MSHFTASLTIIFYIVCMRTRVTGSFHTSRCDINTGINAEAPLTGSPARSLPLSIPAEANHSSPTHHFFGPNSILFILSICICFCGSGHMIDSAPSPIMARPLSAANKEILESVSGSVARRRRPT